MLNISLIIPQLGLQQTCGLTHFQLQSTFPAHNLELRVTEHKGYFNSRIINVKNNMTVL